MKKNSFEIVNYIYSENTLVGLIITAVVAFFGITIFPDFGTKIISFLIPLFIIVVCIEILRIRKNIEIIKNKTDDSLKFIFFISGEEFDDYLRTRLRNVKDLKIVHFSTGGILSEESNPNRRIYLSIIDNFIENGGRFQRVFADTVDGQIFKDSRIELEKYKTKKYYSFFFDKVLIKEGRIHNIMIIDNEEVCLGGGYYNLFEYNTISIRHKEFTKFNIDYFEGLKQQSITLRNGAKVFWDILDKKIKEKENKN